MRTAVKFLREQNAATERRACRLVGIGRSTHRYRQRRNERREALRDKAERERCQGFPTATYIGLDIAPVPPGSKLR